MQITTKFNIGDKAWMMIGNKAIEVKIFCIATSTNHKESKINYSVNEITIPRTRNIEVAENVDLLFPTKEDLLKSL